MSIRERTAANISRGVFETQRGNIEEVKYEQHPEDSTRDAYKQERESALDEALRKAKELTALAQSVQRATNRAQEALDEFLAGGRHNEAQKNALGELFTQFAERAKAVPAEGEGGKTAEEVFDALFEDVVASFETVPVVAVTAGDFKPDKSPATEGGTGDYGEGHDGSVWGIVTNEDSMPGDARLVIERKETTELASTERAAKEGKLTAAEGSGFEGSPEEWVSDKRVVASFDISLLLEEGKLTQFNGLYVVKILLPSEMRGEEGLIVVREEKGAAEVCRTTIEDGKYLVFETTRLSGISVLGEGTVNLWWLIITLLVVLAAELVVIVLLLFGKKGREKTASVLPLGLLTVFIPNGAVVVCIVLGVCVVAAGVGIFFAARRNKPSEEKASEEGDIKDGE